MTTRRTTFTGDRLTMTFRTAGNNYQSHQYQSNWFIRYLSAKVMLPVSINRIMEHRLFLISRMGLISQICPLVVLSIHRFHGWPPSFFPSVAHAHQHGACMAGEMHETNSNALQAVHFADQAPLLMRMCGAREAKWWPTMKTKRAYDRPFSQPPSPLRCKVIFLESTHGHCVFLVRALTFAGNFLTETWKVLSCFGINYKPTDN
jgi:hypothetical protein